MNLANMVFKEEILFSANIEVEVKLFNTFFVHNVSLISAGLLYFTYNFLKTSKVDNSAFYKLNSTS